MECTRHVLENMEPKARVNPAMRTQVFAAHTTGNDSSEVRLESRPSRITEVYVRMQPMMMRLLR